MGLNQRGLYSLASDANNPAYVKGYWYAMHEGTVGAGVAMGAAVLKFAPFRIRTLVNIQQLGARITTLAAGGNVQLGIYPAQRDTFAPTGSVLMATGNLPTDAAGLVAGSVGSVQVPAGIYWFAVNVDATAGGVVVMQNILSANADFNALIGASTQALVSASATASCIIRNLNTVPFGTWPTLTNLTVQPVELSSNSWAAGQFQVAA